MQERDDAGSLTQQFVRGTSLGGGIGGILYSGLDSPGRKHFVYNAIGSTVATVSGFWPLVVESTNDYDAFGKVVAATGATDNNRLFCTKERSSGIGLDNFGFRYYDPILGRFLTRDPAGYPDGPNNYLYCNNNPINHIDPLGLWGVHIGGLKLGDDKPWLAYDRDSVKAHVGGIANIAKGAGKAAYGMTTGLGEQISLTARDAAVAYSGGDDFKSAAYQGALRMGAEGKGTGAIVGEGLLQASGVRQGERITQSAVKGFQTGDFGEFQENIGGVVTQMAASAVALKATTKVAEVKATGKAGVAPESGIVNSGGRFGDLDAARQAGEVGHHAPQNAYNRTIGRSRADGPALGMTTEDHVLTRTWRGRGVRSMREDAGLTARQRLAKDVRDVRSHFGRKYNNGAQEMIDYAKTLPEYKK